MPIRGLERLRRFENRIIDIARRHPALVRLRQYGYSRRDKHGFRHPIYVLEIGKKSALRKNPFALVAGVHGLETIAIRVLLDFLNEALNPKSKVYLREIKSGKLALVTMPIVNPGGIVANTRSNPAGVDLMRNSGVDAESAMPFFGGHRLGNLLPYFRGSQPEPEARQLMRFVREYLFPVKKGLAPALDIHSGYGSLNHLWWPYAFTKDPCEDTGLFQAIAKRLKSKLDDSFYRFGPQSESYTTHGDIWDKLYLECHNPAKPRTGARFLPFTLEIGTWAQLRQNPKRLLKKKLIFNPDKESKKEFIRAHRRFLYELVRLTKLGSLKEYRL